MDDKTIKEIMAETRRKCEFMANTFGVPKEPQNFMELALMREAISETEVKTRQRCIAELKELKDKLLKEWQAMGGWGGNTIDTAKAGAEFQVIDRAIAKLKEAPAKVNDKT